MKNLIQLREEREQLVAKPLALISLATEQNRQLTAEENAEIDAINGEGGQIDQIDAMIDRLEKVEARQKTIVREKFNQGQLQIDSRRADTTDILAGVTVPAKHKSRSPLKAFVGDNAERDAYVTGHWALATIRNRKSSIDFLNDIGLGVNAAMTTGENDHGGYLVPDVTEATIVRLVQSYGVFRQNVGRVWPLRNGSLSIPKHGSGFTWNWVGETAALTASDTSLQRINLVAKKGGVLGRISSELFEDSIVSLGDYIATEIAFAKAYAEDDAGFNGDGTQSYGGIVGLENRLAAGAIATAESNDNTLAELTVAPIHEAMGKLAEYPGIQPAWYMHKSVWENGFKRLAFANGDPTHYMAGMSPMFMGYPVRFAQVMPSGGPATDLASTIVAYFGDLSQTVAMGDSRGLTIVGDSSVYFTTDEIAIKGTCRLDINVHDIGDANNAGAMVAVKMNAA